MYGESQNIAGTKIALLTDLLRKLYLFETLWCFFFLDALISVHLIDLVKLSQISVVMGRAKHCTVEKRKTIKNLIFEGNTYAQVGRIIGCSNKMICSDLKYDTKPETRWRKLAMSTKMVTHLVRESKKGSFTPASELKKDLNISAAITTVRSCLRDNKLYARSPRKVPLLTKKNIAKRIKFANQ